MKKLSWVVVAGMMLGGVAQAGAQAPAAAQGQKPAAAPKTGATSKTGTIAKGATAARPAFNRALLNPALLKEKAPEEYDVKFTTTKGDFTIHVTRAWAPAGADRFYTLAKHHFYDNASFFRVLDGFVAQFGISAYPRVAAAWKNAAIKDDPVAQSNKNGYVTYAMGGPNTRTTQVFINLGNNTQLDRMGFAPFGQVIGEGMLTVVKLHGGYGDGADMGGNGPLQGEIEKQGKAYLDKSFPKLDSIKTAVIVSLAASDAPAKK